MTRMIARLLTVLALAHVAGVAWAQGALLQGGPTTVGHVPMYLSTGGAQPVVQDSGTAAGGGAGVGLSELNITSRAGNGDNTAPYASNGNGQRAAHFCMNDAPVTNATGYHWLCFDPNSQGGGMIAYGAAGGASNLPLYMTVNGSTFEFPFVLTGVVGPNVSVVGDVACWNNISGTLLSNCGTHITPPGTTIVGDVACWNSTTGAALSDCGPAYVASNAALKAVAVTAGRAVMRLGYGSAGDNGAAYYLGSGSACSLNAGAGDNGYQVAPNTGSGCWVAKFDVVPPTIEQWGAVADGSTNNKAAIGAALSYMSTGGGVLRAGLGTFGTNTNNVIPTGVTVRGAGQTATAFKALNNDGNAIFQTNTAKSNIAFTDFTCDTNSQPLVPCIFLEEVTNVTVARIYVKNNISWGVYIGHLAGSSSAILNGNILIEDNMFEHAVDATTFRLESLVLSNAGNAMIRRNKFRGTTNEHPAIGLYQVLDNITVTQNDIQDYAYGVYFSQSTNNITISYNDFRDNNFCIQGANQSDNGNFGYLTANNINIIGNNFTDCHLAAANLGAIRGGSFVGNRLWENDVKTVTFGKGFDTCPTSPVAPCSAVPNSAVTNFIVSQNVFWNNNQSASTYNANGVLYFHEIGGKLDMTLTDNIMFDTQGTTTQRASVTWTGAFTWDHIAFTGGSMPGYAGTASFNTLSSAALTNMSVVNVGNLTVLPLSAGSELFTGGSQVIRPLLPTSAAGLTAGTLWNDAGTVKVAP